MPSNRSVRVTAAILAATAISWMAGSGVAFAQRSPATGPDQPDKAPAVKTYVYKTVGDVKIEADVYPIAQDTPRGHPVVIHLHGGALIGGSRKGMSGILMGTCQKEGFVMVSADYRLAPEVKLPEIIADIRDLFKWVNEQGPKLFNAQPNNFAVIGESAGGYLTMMAGLLEPRPRGLVSYYGYGDVDGEWLTKPSEFYCSDAFRRGRPLLTREEAYMGVTGKVLTDTSPPHSHGQIYLYFRQKGLWTREVTGFDPATERDKITPYCPVRNITPKYPPIVMLHGTADTDVPCQKSLDMAEQLKKNHVYHEMIEIPGGGHGFGGGDQQAIMKARLRSYEFITEVLSGKLPAATPSPESDSAAPSTPAAGSAASKPEVYQAWPFNAKEAARRQDETAEALGVDKEMSLTLAEGVDVRFTLIPAGRFMMGSGPLDMKLARALNVKYGNREGIFDNELPQHEVILTKPFYMGTFLVTKAQFAAFADDAKYVTGCEKGGECWAMGSKNGKPDGVSWKRLAFEQGDDHPVVCISWLDADAFCKWMSRKTGRAISLPTEAQWEYACRAGVTTMFLWGNNLGGGSGYCNIFDKATQAKLKNRAGTPIPWTDNYAYTSPVGKFKPNNFGLYDMIGNAEQFCAEWWGPDYYGKSPKEDPPGATSGAGRSRRGAGWNSKGPRIAFRPMFRPEVSIDTFGMRVICTDVGRK
jgi:formylglycine-generating enzyme required for sulfatase activity/acetyl esterase/lipase